jgi:hypothetical protein
VTDAVLVEGADYRRIDPAGVARDPVETPEASLGIEQPQGSALRRVCLPSPETRLWNKYPYPPRRSGSSYSRPRNRTPSSHGNARYLKNLVGPWRWIYAIGAVITLYFNVVVLIVQAFEKVPALHSMAPTQTEQPFNVTQLVVLALFMVLTIVAAIRFRPQVVPSV